MIPGFEISGRILEMGGLAHELTGYQIDEEVVAHNYPLCGGLAESCLIHHRDVFRLMRRTSLENAAAIMDDYSSALLTMGRRARIQKDECFLINAKYSRSALAVIDLATKVFHAKPIAICNDARRAKLCSDLGATVVFHTDQRCLLYKLRKVIGKKKVRVIMETEDEPCCRDMIECLQYDGLIGFLDLARNKWCSNFRAMSSNHTAFAVAVEHYKFADVLVYRETVQQLLDYQAECAIQPRISAIFGLHHVNDAFDYYTTVPSGKVLIDMKDCNRISVCDEL